MLEAREGSTGCGIVTGTVTVSGTGMVSGTDCGKVWGKGAGSVILAQF